MGWALLMSPKGRNASRDGLIKLVVAVCLLIRLLLRNLLCAKFMINRYFKQGCHFERYLGKFDFKICAKENDERDFFSHKF